MKAQKRLNSHEIYEKPSCWGKYSLVAKDWLTYGPRGSTPVGELMDAPCWWA